MSSHIQGKAHLPRLIPCIGCIHRLASDPLSEYQPCQSQSGPTAAGCVMCNRRKQRCYLLPIRAIELGREFQNACIRRFEGEEVENLEILGERTLQAINQHRGQAGKYRRSSSASMARMPVDLDSILEDGGLAALTDDQLSVSGQPQADPREQQSPQQLQRKEVALQLNDERQPACCDTRKELESMRAQMEIMKAQVESMEAQIQDLIQVIIGRRQDGTETRSITLHFP